MAEYVKQEMNDVRGTGEQKAYYRLKTYDNWGMDRVLEMLDSYGIKPGEVQKVVSGLNYAISTILSLGHTATIEGIGTFRASLGLNTGKEMDGFDPDETARNAQSVRVRKVLFKADKRLVQEVSSKIRLERGEDQHLHLPQTSREERLAQLHNYLTRHAFIKVGEYQRLTGLSRYQATQELLAFDRDETSGIGHQGRSSHKLYVKRESSQ
ncbi:MAG: hypothetical protein IJT97_00980 [Bacteroidaceae bacterium]|nr:hypothetical protein [Bacteroidaceae bacterium]